MAGGLNGWVKACEKQIRKGSKYVKMHVQPPLCGSICALTSTLSRYNCRRPAPTLLAVHSFLLRDSLQQIKAQRDPIVGSIELRG